MRPSSICSTSARSFVPPTYRVTSALLYNVASQSTSSGVNRRSESRSVMRFMRKAVIFYAAARSMTYPTARFPRESDMLRRRAVYRIGTAGLLVILGAAAPRAERPAPLAAFEFLLGTWEAVGDPTGA